MHIFAEGGGYADFADFASNFFFTDSATLRKKMLYCQLTSLKLLRSVIKSSTFLMVFPVLICTKGVFMIAVTGGAGFIGSAIAWKLNEQGIDDILIVDLPGMEEHRNLKPLAFRDFMTSDQFAETLEAGRFGKSLEVIFHLGAGSDTTETNRDFLAENNTGYTRRLAVNAVARSIRFIYASSAATYGDGSRGHRDDHAGIERLEPLNLYAKSKQEFDLWALRRGLLDHIAGLKYFNVFGPNEYHKGDMRSMVVKGYEQIRDTGKIRLFKSDRPEWPDGGQDRDFIYGRDAVDMTLFFRDNPRLNGIFNIGTGKPATWNMLAEALFDAMGVPANIEYVDMPERLKGKYQYHTCAEMDKLRRSGYSKETIPFRDAVREYVREYLMPGAYLIPDR